MSRVALEVVGAVGDLLKAQRNEMLRDISARFERALGLSPEGPRTEVNWVPACASLAVLVEGASGPADPLLSALAERGGDLPWQAAPRELCPASFAAGHAFVELFGPDGMVPGAGVRMGLFLLGPGVFYPSHVHEAEEIYLVLAGEGDWQGSHGKFESKGPGNLIHHVPHEPHAIRTGRSGVLTLWAWRGEIGFESYRFV